MCALNCHAWSLQDSLVASVESADDEYTAMIRGLVQLAGCFHPMPNAYRGLLIRRWWIGIFGSGCEAGLIFLRRKNRLCRVWLCL
eukprot:scaffold44517_cov47-Attheya_sp.AAC.1